MAMNEHARQMDVEMGATKAQLEAWEVLVLRARSEAQEASAHAALLDCAQSFSPEVEDTAPDTVLLNLFGLEPLLGPLPKIARGLAQRCSQMGLATNVAVAANPDAALLAARGFPGVTLIPEGHEAQRLGNLTVDVLFESFSSDAEQARRWLETFDRWGVRNLRSLAFLLNRMLEQVCARLGERALAAQELRLKLELTQRHEDCDPTQTSTFTRTLRLPLPMLDAKVFLKLLQLDLQAHPPGAPIVKVHLSAEPARPRATQSGLFQPIFPEPEKLELTLARIAGIVGEERVGSAQLLDTHREGAFEMRHFAPVEPETKPPGKQKKDVAVQEQDDVLEATANAEERMSTVIALRLFRPPLRAVVSVREGRPVRMKCIHRPEIAGEIVWSAGPWRSSGDWSEQEGWSREEWDIAVSSENSLVLYRLAQDKLNVQWLVEGTYD